MTKAGSGGGGNGDEVTDKTGSQAYAFRRICSQEILGTFPSCACAGCVVTTEASAQTQRPRYSSPCPRATFSGHDRLDNPLCAASAPPDRPHCSAKATRSFQRSPVVCFFHRGNRAPVFPLQTQAVARSQPLCGSFPRTSACISVCEFLINVKSLK